MKTTRLYNYQTFGHIFETPTIQLFVHDLLATASDKETFLQDFLKVLKKMPKNLVCFIDSTCIQQVKIFNHTIVNDEKN